LVRRHALVRIDHRPPEPPKGINTDIASSVHTATAVVAGMRSLSGPTITFAAVEHDPHVTPVPKLSAQVFISV